MSATNNTGGLEIISPVFRNGSPIPAQYTCAGQNVNPPINIFNVPAKTLSLGLVMHDPDAPSGDYLHWLVWDIPPHTESIPVNSVPIGAVQGVNGGGKVGYVGPCPPSGTHRYIFELYALDATIDLPSGSKLEAFQKKMSGHVLEESKIVGTFSAKG